MRLWIGGEGEVGVAIEDGVMHEASYAAPVRPVARLENPWICMLICINCRSRGLACDLRYDVTRALVVFISKFLGVIIAF